MEDKEKYAKDLWEELAKLYTTTNTQAIINLMQKFEALRFKDVGDFSHHISSMRELADKLAYYVKKLAEADKVQYLLKLLPESFSASAQVPKFVPDLDFDKLEIAIRTEVVRRKITGLQPSKRDNNTDFRTAAACNHSFQTVSSRGGRRRGGFRGRGRGSGFRGSGFGRGRGRGRGRGQFDGPFSQGFNNYETTQVAGCFMCGDLGHFVRNCPLPPPGGAPRGRGRMRRQAAGSHQVGGWQTQQGPWAGNFNNQGQNAGNQPMQANNTMRAEDAPPPAPQPSVPSTFFDQSKQFGSYSQGLRRANVVRFRSKVATKGKNKKSEALIDSGATQNFLYDRELFVNYEEMVHENEEGPAGQSLVIGKGEVEIPLFGGNLVDACHVPDFNCHILAVASLVELVDVTFSCSIKPFNVYFMFETETKKITFETHINNGLYRMLLQGNRRIKTINASTYEDISEAKKWHERLGHISTERYIALAEQDPTVKKFSRKTLESIICAPCMEAKIKREPARPIEFGASRPIQEVQVDTSGNVKTPSLNGENYVAFSICLFTAKSDVRLLHDRREFQDAL